jgi:hypothetical protein
MKKLPPDVKHTTQQAIHLEDSVAATQRPTNWFVSPFQGLK